MLGQVECHLAWTQSESRSGKERIMRSFLRNGCSMATSRWAVDSLSGMKGCVILAHFIAPFLEYSQESHATVTPPSSESEKRMRNVPFSLLNR